MKKLPDNEVAKIRTVRVSDLINDCMRKHHGTLGRAIIAYHKQLTQLENTLKKVHNGR